MIGEMLGAFFPSTSKPLGTLLARTLPCALAASLALTLQATADPSPADFAARFQTAERAGQNVVQGSDGWLFLPAELRMLSFPRFWGADAPKTSRSPKPEWADPLPAIVNFHTQLKARGITLLLVPVPPKASIYPEKLFGTGSTPSAPTTAPIANFLAALREAGVETLDLAPLFTANRAGAHGPMFCATDTHWSGSACVLAAQEIADSIRSKLPTPAPNTFQAEWKSVPIQGDLLTLAGAASTTPSPEKIDVRSISHSGSGAPVDPDPSSPLLLLGDSHTLVFHDFLAERSGLADQLAHELGFAPDVIGTRGSGATPVRLSLFRRSVKDPAYLTHKKVVVWCLSAREFTEADSGWQLVPLTK